MLRITSLVAITGLAAFSVAFARAEEPSHGFFTTSDGTRIHYMEMGNGVPVVLIHGGGGSAEGNWFSNGIARALARNHHVVALDCRGHGKSGDYPKPAASGDGARASDVVSSGPNWPVTDVLELMDHLKIEKAHIHGYSWGGTITEGLLAAHPERCITAAFGGWGIPEVDPEMKAKVPPDKTGTDPQDAEATAKFWASRPARPQASGATSAAPKPAAGADVPVRAGDAQGAKPKGGDGGQGRLHPPMDLSKITIPVLAINGEFDKPLEKTTRMAREVKNFKSVVLPGKSHMTAIMAGYMPKEYLGSLVEFINANDPKR